MAIWMDDMEAETSTRWRGTDMALVASLAVVVVLQIAVAFAVVDFGGAPEAAESAVKAPPGATRFSADPVNPGYDGSAATAGPALWFARGDAAAHVSFATASEHLYAPASFAFNASAVSMVLSEVPVDYRDTETVPATTVATTVAAFAPTAEPRAMARAGAGAELQNVAALRDYLGDSGLAAMGARCGDLLGQAYKYDGGLIALCRQVRATL